VELRQALIALALLLLPCAAFAQVERFAVVVGNNAGEASEAQLSYAEADAERMASALESVGGVRPENLVLLRGQDAGTFRRTLIAINDRVRAAGRQSVLVVYYSGHSDALALHQSGSSLELPELEQLVRGSAASFRLLIVDACRSGALTRVKGGTPVAPFELRVEERVAGEGAVFLTSSSASEDSQESDEIKGSFFTHALVSGLLGAADLNGDGRVTLDEAYRYAYDATLRASSRSLSGVQHPTFQYEVHGEGDVVLAQLTGSTSAIEFPAQRTWLLFQNGEEGAVVGEVNQRDRSRRLSVRPGKYFVRGRAPDVLLEGVFEVPPGGVAAVDESKLTRTSYARLVRKGGSRGSAASIELEGRVRSQLLDDSTICPGAALGLSIALRSFTLTPRAGWCRGGFSNPGIDATLDEYDFELAAAHVWDLHLFSLQAGVTAGGSLLVQRFRTAGYAPRRSTAALQLSPFAGLIGDISRQSYLYLNVFAATYLFRSENAQSESGFGPSFAVRLSFGFGVRL
jgi:Caspase domain